MNLRALKKREKRAMKELIRRGDYTASDFTPADGGESIYAPDALHKRHQRHGFVHPGPMPGTPLVWHCCSYEYDEWDASLPSVVLAEIRLAEETDWDALIRELDRTNS